MGWDQSTKKLECILDAPGDPGSPQAKQPSSKIPSDRFGGFTGACSAKCVCGRVTGLSYQCTIIYIYIQFDNHTDYQIHVYETSS